MTNSIVRSSFLAIFSMLMASSADCTQPFGKSVRDAYAGNVDHYVRLNNQRNAARGFEVKGKNLHRQNIGKRTVAEIKRILETGEYTGDGNFNPIDVNPINYRKVQVYDSLNKGIGRVMNRAGKLSAVGTNSNVFATEYSFAKENSGEAAIDFHHKANGKIAVLNFGNALKRCGGFLNGRGAQEESLSRISTDSASLMRKIADNLYYRYNYNLLCNGKMSQRVVVSPNALIFRTDETGADWGWIEEPVPVSIITASAFDKNQYEDVQNYLEREAKERKKPYKKKPVPSVKEIEENTKRLIKNSVLAAMNNDCETFILGAFGCGVCASGVKNKDAVYHKIARYFKEILIDKGFGKHFKKIVFPICNDHIRDIFETEFRNAHANIINKTVFGQKKHK